MRNRGIRAACQHHHHLGQRRFGSYKSIELKQDERTERSPVAPRVQVVVCDVHIERNLHFGAVFVVQHVLDDAGRFTRQVVTRVGQERQQQHVELIPETMDHDISP